MASSSRSFLLVMLGAVAGCGGASAAPGSSSTTASGATVEPEVRRFMASVATKVTSEGPQAWQAVFADEPSFFMAVNGRLVFPDRATATAGIGGLGQKIRHIELQWGPDLRVDALTPELANVACTYHELRLDADGSRVDEAGYFTGVAERRGDRWQLRNAHWSVPTSP